MRDIYLTFQQTSTVFTVKVKVSAVQFKSTWYHPTTGRTLSI